MTSLERRIAEAAIASRPDSDMVRLESEIAIAAGVDAAEAKKVLAHLVNEFFLKLCSYASWERG
jgi:hypothetical protein